MHEPHEPQPPFTGGGAQSPTKQFPLSHWLWATQTWPFGIEQALVELPLHWDPQ